MMQTNTYCRSTELLEAELGDEIVALDADRGTCFGFNNVASSVWRMLAEPKTAEEIAVALEQEYDVDPGRCREELAELLDDLVAKGVVALEQ